MIDAEVNIQTEFLEKTLAELNVELSMNITICQGYISDRLVSNGNGSGYKLCKLGEIPQRRLNLILDRYTSDGSQDQEFKSDLRSAILIFWDKSNTAFSWTKTILY